MRREDVAHEIENALIKLGVKRHCSEIKIVPSRVRVSFLLAGKLYERELRSGISPPELEEVMHELERFVRQVEGTIHIEDAIAAAK